MPTGQDKRFGSLCQFREMGGREVFGFYSESQNPFLWVWTQHLMCTLIVVTTVGHRLSDSSPENMRPTALESHDRGMKRKESGLRKAAASQT